MLRFVANHQVRRTELDPKLNRPVAIKILSDELAKAAGIMRHDIKPANILVAKNGYAKLADFGVAKLEEESKRDRTQTLTESQTRPGVVASWVPTIYRYIQSGNTPEGHSRDPSTARR